ncbi:MAG: HEAT repeat domain-containing protein, partial [Gemmatimonadales bacterium]
MLIALALPCRATAQQQDEALVGELSRLLAAADARAFDAPLFREALRYPEPFVRRQAALAAGRIGDPAAIDLLVEALGDSDRTVQGAAAFGLGLVKDSRAVGSLLALVRSAPGEQGGPPQAEAVTALAKIGGDKGAAALRGILGNGTTPGVPTSLAQSTALLEAWRLGSRAPVPALFGYAEDPDGTARWHALYSLARLRVARGVHVLLNACADQMPFVRAVAARGVSRALTDSAGLDPEDVAGRLRPLLGDRDPHVRINALRALATFRDSAFSGLAVPLVNDAELNVAVQAETTLGALGGSAAVSALSARLSSAVFALRRQAVVALAQA